ncbi:MAG TPA: hypothetical protein IGS53_19560 [Leptolyngbyaceae cyanobacterium M33_DOE_097]|uniref:Uncharacterized protein n=1 Tax=Oscillatoriales cyanobacterium SpSt-418 TaxID=2282169 RepID=A0A7C3PDP8_9CYAN|nr:hypothetical protein [Leptolyngbyaceae cyanobacterium M33_DOE_097]
MNAAEQATSLELTSKIAAVVNLFKTTFPAARSDLKPWANDPDTRELVDPDSIDIGFHFPGVSKSMQCRSLLIQIRFYEDPETQKRRAIGIELAGFTHRGKQWWLSTIDNWNFAGESEPSEEMREQLKDFLRQALELFNQ